jgi:hypothetical protein
VFPTNPDSVAFMDIVIGLLILAAAVGLMWIVLRILAAVSGVDGRESYEASEKSPARRLVMIAGGIFGRKRD